MISIVPATEARPLTEGQQRFIAALGVVAAIVWVVAVLGFFAAFLWALLYAIHYAVQVLAGFVFFTIIWRTFKLGVRLT